MLVPVAELRGFVAALLEGLGLPEQHADDTAQALVDADLSGRSTHGVRLLPPYAARLREGAIAAAPELRVLSRTGAVSVLDGGNGLGQAVAAWAVRHSIDVARELGAAVTTVRRSNHLGALGSFTRLAAEQGMVCFLTQNTRANMAAAGGRQAAVGNNPFSFAVPAPGFPVVLDLSCSAVARSNIDLAAERGESIPEGWALGPDGRPTTDAQQALLGAVLPFAGHKGSGLAVVMGALAGVLSGATFGAAVPPLADYSRERDLGHFLVVVDVRALGSADDLAERMDRYVGEIADSAPAPGVERVRVPGEAADDRRRELLQRGIALPTTLLDTLRALADEVAVPSDALR
ncbi:LDH2 family malate/lactate/ureidoglycolate dehydrogenase [Blastococcus colisei]|uniref:LDH2 family malate/lactate/ureidoglycolate dehydrogenase n=1 Tax=Blastococcus colisei TaxID=1564162 RepID=A0A543P232_9ACTN|nr:LDH2 family malate/lactate/ureidoglycolate dehydrogenase [Blastococcus colisei]